MLMHTLHVSAVVLLLATSPVLAEPVSPWQRDGAAALRLVDAGAAAKPGTRLAAIAIQLEPGWKTYWRQPGASGVPPRFDFSGSKNVAEAHIAYPAPERASDEDGVTNVYHGAVTLPVTVTPRDPNAPVELKLVADYGVCERVCVPVRAETELRLAPGVADGGPAADEVRTADAKTPKPVALGNGAALSVASVRRVPGPEGGSAIEIVTAVPQGAEAALFAETGEGDYAPAPEPSGAAKDGKATFRMAFDEPELPKTGLKLTLAAGGKAIETPVTLDEIAPSH